MDEINKIDIKTNELLLKNVKKRELDNKMLPEKNEKANNELEVLKLCLKNTHVDVKIWKKKYQELQKENSDLLAKLSYTKKVKTNYNFSGDPDDSVPNEEKTECHCEPACPRHHGEPECKRHRFG